MKPAVCILDYGAGNIGSVTALLKTICDDVTVSREKHDICRATHFILPGVGAFTACMNKIKDLLPLEAIHHQVYHFKKPFLGICVGMQVLADKGYEFGEHEGLGWIGGIVERLDSNGLPLPHMGWNDASVTRDNPLLPSTSVHRDFYFANSFAYREHTCTDIVAKTRYGIDFPSIIQKNNIFGVQFHPEKSQLAGRQLIQNFLSIGAYRDFFDR